MAKLKARGRQEIFRIEKSREIQRQGWTERYRIQKALMSDCNILEKVEEGGLVCAAYLTAYLARNDSPHFQPFLDRLEENPL
jgi:hypothetical protein